MIKNKHYLHNNCFKSAHPDQLFLQQNKQQKTLEAGSLQVGHDPLGDLQDSSVVGLTVCVGAVFRDAVPHREMELHQSQGVLNGIYGSSPDEGLQLAAGRLQPLRQALGSRHALGLERPKQCLERPAQAI